MNDFDTKLTFSFFSHALPMQITSGMNSIFSRALHDALRLALGCGTQRSSIAHCGADRAVGTPGLTCLIGPQSGALSGDRQAD
jgi:hypothetical protein